MITRMLFLLLLLPSPLLAQVPQLPPEYQDYRWHRYTTDNFEILSINPEHGIEIRDSVEEVRVWTARRWGLPDVSYRHKCMILCVPDQEVFKKWFHRSNVDPKLAKSANVDGSPRTVYAIWMAAGGNWLSGALPEKVARVSMLDSELTSGTKYPYWVHVGVGALNNDVDGIRSLLSGLDASDTYSCRDILDAKVSSGTADETFKAKCASACLLLKKQQYGYDKFIQFMQEFRSGGDNALAVFGWRDCQHFELSYNAFTKNLVYDIKAGVTPDIGLTWFVRRSVKR